MEIESADAVISYLPRLSSTTMNIKNIQNTNTQFLLLKSHRGDWNFVTDHREKHEADNDTFKREILEETGIIGWL
ncbi:MAG TPA: NUDIX domain-containing protein [Nitrososphaeraceae archaeon]|nr:NUDIX domain-containing protein [Nitrososphaeraceae archaeon]